MLHHKQTAQIVGVCFLLSFLSYGFGMSLMEIIQAPNMALTEINTHKNEVIVGMVLVTILHTLCNIGLLVGMFHLMKPAHQIGALFYLGAGLIATLLLALGGMLFMLPLSFIEQVIQTNQPDAAWFRIVQTCAIKGNFYCYQIGMTLWGIGGLVMCYVFCQTRLVPLFWARWGWVGYVLFIAGTLLELFGMPYGTLLSIPGGLFEISLAIRFIVISRYQPI